MALNLHQGYLYSTIKLFTYYKSLGEKAIAQLEEKQLFKQFNEDSNSISTVVNHLHGNMLSRWKDFLISDGEKPWRNRDQEFEEIQGSKDAMMKNWEEGWDCLLQTLNSLTPEDMEKIIYIRNEGHTVYEAILRQTAHYAYHVGQIVYAAKILKEGAWSSLSIPKNASKVYNQKKFEGKTQDGFFTDRV
ncbi:MAG: DUF1572 domain-containing protein [Bacteroidota bacterium]|nr:DUF1572 domain-containing protein [Bacteroidota bacterium]